MSIPDRLTGAARRYVDRDAGLTITDPAPSEPTPPPPTKPTHPLCPLPLSPPLLPQRPQHPPLPKLEVDLPQLVKHPSCCGVVRLDLRIGSAEKVEEDEGVH